MEEKKFRVKAEQIDSGTIKIYYNYMDCPVPMEVWEGLRQRIWQESRATINLDVSASVMGVLTLQGNPVLAALSAVGYEEIVEEVANTLHSLCNTMPLDLDFRAQVNNPEIHD